MRKLLAALALAMLMCSTGSAMPRVEVLVEDEIGIYSSEITDRLEERLRARLSEAWSDASVTEEFAAEEYRLDVRVLSLGLGKMINNGLATTFSMGGAMSSIFISPLSGSSMGALGWIHATKPVFALSVNVKLVRLSDGEVMYDRNRLGKSNIAKKDERPPREVIDDAIEDAAETIARPLIKDSARKTPKFFR